MRRREFLATFASLLPAQSRQRPNIVILLADDLGWNDVGFHGGPAKTPHLDRLASEGQRLEHFYTYPLCSPTRSALMTGRNPVRFGVAYSVIRPWANNGLPLTEELLPAHFQRAGYQTAVIGKWHLGHASRAYLPRSRGFDHFYGHVNGAIDYYRHDRFDAVDWQRNGETVSEQGYTTELLATEAVRWLKARDASKPFFLYLPFNAPHAPLQAPADLLKNYDSIADPDRRAYTAMVDALDRAVGRIVAALPPGTLLFFSSDNGGPLAQGASNGNLRAGKATTYEGGIRVTAFLHGPGVPKGEFRQVMTMWDVLPTLAGAANIPLRTRLPLDGVNLWPQLTGKQKPIPRADLFFCTQPGNGIQQYAVRDGEWKLVRTMTRPVREELFHIPTDPEEKQNRMAEEYGLSASLRKRMDDWIALHPRDGITHTGNPPKSWTPPKDWAKAPSD